MLCAGGSGQPQVDPQDGDERHAAQALAQERAVARPCTLKLTCI